MKFENQDEGLLEIAERVDVIKRTNSVV